MKRGKAGFSACMIFYRFTDILMYRSGIAGACTELLFPG